jgi:hypothetical protein
MSGLSHDQMRTIDVEDLVDETSQKCANGVHLTNWPSISTLVWRLRER